AAQRALSRRRSGRPAGCGPGRQPGPRQPGPGRQPGGGGVMSVAAPATVFRAPDDHTATEPPEYRGLARDEVRLLVASPGGGTHARFRDLPQHLRAGDLLVVNTSATLPAELDGRRSGNPVVVHLATDLGDGTWVAE